MKPVCSGILGTGDVESAQDVAGNNQAGSDTSPEQQQQQQQQLAQWLWKVATFTLGMAVGKFHLNQQAHVVLFDQLSALCTNQDNYIRIEWGDTFMARVLDAARGEAEGDGAAPNIAVALGALGLVTTSTAITMAVTYLPPPGGLGDHTCVPLALSGLAFFTGIAQVGASVWVSGDPRRRRSAGYKVLYASVCAVAFTVASLLISW